MAAVAARAPPPTQWQLISSWLIPALSVVGALATYLAVGDRLVAACAPQLHARAWRALAGFASGSAAPCLRRACGAGAASAAEAFAAGVVKRLADLAEDRDKHARAAATLKLTRPRGAEEVGDDSADVHDNPLCGAAGEDGEGELVDRGALAAAQWEGDGGGEGAGGDDEPLPAGWVTATDAEGFTYFHSEETGESAWERPAAAAGERSWERQAAGPE